MRTGLALFWNNSLHHSSREPSHNAECLHMGDRIIAEAGSDRICAVEALLCVGRLASLLPPN